MASYITKGTRNRSAVKNLLTTILSSSSSCPCHSQNTVITRRGGNCAVHNKNRGFANQQTTDYAFQMTASDIKYGRGVTREIGMDLENIGCKNVMILTDPNLVDSSMVANVVKAITAQNVGFHLYHGVSVEPTNASLEHAVSFAKRNNVDGFVSVGGGSVMDTAKVANLFFTHEGAQLLDFVNAPVGKGLPIPEWPKMKPHIAVPTTAGTGSETTGQAIFDHEPLRAKTGIGSRLLKPTLGIIDPDNTQSMPRQIAVASGFDVLCHSLESYTAIPYNERSPMPANPNLRPAYQGQNPISDVWSLQALVMLSKYFRRAVDNEDDYEAKEQVTLAATYAGVGFGNAGVHLCHGMSYPISGLNKHKPNVMYNHPDYPTNKPLVPHGISVVLPAPAVFRFTAVMDPARHLECAAILGADVSNAKSTAEYAGNLLADELLKLMDHMDVPLGIGKIGFQSEDIEELVRGALPQQRVLKLAPNPEVGHEQLSAIYEDAMSY